MIQLTDASGRPVWVAALGILRVQADAKGHGAEVWTAFVGTGPTSPARLFVKETAEEIVALRQAKLEELFRSIRAALEPPPTGEA